MVRNQLIIKYRYDQFQYSSYSGETQDNDHGAEFNVVGTLHVNKNSNRGE
jgi:hypothetical protein